MYVGTHYNSYYNTLFGNRSTIYESFATSNTTNSYLKSLLNTSVNDMASGNSLANAAGLKFISALKEGGSGLSFSLNSLSSGNAFRKAAAVSSNTDALTVSSGNSQFSFNSIPETTVKIDQIATGQINNGAALNANAPNSASGYQQFSIETNGRTYNFSINMAAGDTNKELQQKMAAAINAQKIGIDATVSTNTEDNTSTLQLSAAGTGENAKSTFVIRDVYGNAVAATGTDKVTQKAQNAVYSVNGGANQTSQSNSISLGNGVTATLKQVTVNPVTISQGKDTSFAISQVDNLVQNYNKLYGATLDNAADTKANRLFSQLVNTSKTYASTLSQIGIEFDSNGYMKVNEDKFKQAHESGRLEQFFTENRNTNYGFTNQLDRIARQAQTNTASYISQNTLANSLMDSLNNYDYLNNNFYNNLRNFYQQSGVFASGLLFDFLL